MQKLLRNGLFYALRIQPNNARKGWESSDSWSFFVPWGWGGFVGRGFERRKIASIVTKGLVQSLVFTHYL